MSNEWCREERCRHRHWRSGSMPTHRRGEDCPPTARDRVAHAWHAGSDHAAESPFGGPLCNCMAVAERIMPMLRKAYDEGWFSAVGSAPDDVWFDAWTDDNSNPYEEGRHVDQ